VSTANNWAPTLVVHIKAGAWAQAENVNTPPPTTNIANIHSQHQHPLSEVKMEWRKPNGVGDVQIDWWRKPQTKS
jgi:hypothetical protein